jgi:hypothetical protein
MADLAATIVRTPLEPIELERLRVALVPLLADLDRLRALPLKDCEPPFIFQPVVA